MRKPILRVLLTIGATLSAANLWYLAGLLHTYAQLGDPSGMFAAGPGREAAVIERMRQVCGSFADLYAACAATQQTAGSALADAMHGVRTLVYIQIGISAACLAIFLALLTVSLRGSRTAET